MADLGEAKSCEISPVSGGNENCDKVSPEGCVPQGAGAGVGFPQQTKRKVPQDHFLWKFFQSYYLGLLFQNIVIGLFFIFRNNFETK